MNLNENRKIALRRTCIVGVDKGKSEVVECDIKAGICGGWSAVSSAWETIPLDDLWAQYHGFDTGPIIVNGYTWEYAE